VGRHTVPGTGTPEPDRGFWVRIAVAAVVVLLVGGYLLTTRGGDDNTVGTAAGKPTQSATTSATATPTESATSPSPSASASTTAPAAPPTSSAPAKRPPTLAFTVRYPAYITVRIPGGRTLVSKVFKGGATASYDQKVLQVVNGRPRAVHFVVNGKPRKQGKTGQTETFTVRRK
jgi:hypothetical protein